MSEAAVSADRDVHPQFELNVSLPSDIRFTDTVRELAAHAARHAGCSDAGAEAFGEEVAQAVRAHLEKSDAATIPLVLRRQAGPVEVLVNGRTLTLSP